MLLYLAREEKDMKLLSLLNLFQLTMYGPEIDEEVSAVQNLPVLAVCMYHGIICFEIFNRPMTYDDFCNFVNIRVRPMVDQEISNLIIPNSSHRSSSSDARRCVCRILLLLKYLLISFESHRTSVCFSQRIYTGK
jgi:hypothetical protein